MVLLKVSHASPSRNQAIWFSTSNWVSCIGWTNVLGNFSLFKVLSPTCILFVWTWPLPLLYALIILAISSWLRVALSFSKTILQPGSLLTLLHLSLLYRVGMFWTLLHPPRLYESRRENTPWSSRFTLVFIASKFCGLSRASLQISLMVPSVKGLVNYGLNLN